MINNHDQIVCKSLILIFAENNAKWILITIRDPSRDPSRKYVDRDLPLRSRRMPERDGDLERHQLHPALPSRSRVLILSNCHIHVAWRNFDIWHEICVSFTVFDTRFVSLSKTSVHMFCKIKNEKKNEIKKEKKSPESKEFAVIKLYFKKFANWT